MFFSEYHSLSPFYVFVLKPLDIQLISKLAVTFNSLFLGQIHLNVPDLLFGYTRESTITPTIDVYISLDANYPSGDVSHQVIFNAHFEKEIKISLQKVPDKRKAANGPRCRRSNCPIDKTLPRARFLCTGG